MFTYERRVNGRSAWRVFRSLLLIGGLVTLGSSNNPAIAKIDNEEDLKTAAQWCQTFARMNAGSPSQFRVDVSIRPWSNNSGITLTVGEAQIQTQGTILEHSFFWECMLWSYRSPKK